MKNKKIFLIMSAFFIFMSANVQAQDILTVHVSRFDPRGTGGETMKLHFEVSNYNEQVTLNCTDPGYQSIQLKIIIEETHEKIVRVSGKESIVPRYGVLYVEIIGNEGKVLKTPIGFSLIAGGTIGYLPKMYL